MLSHLLVRFLNWFCLKGVGYQLWSGIGLAIAWPVLYWHRHNCHVRWCPWVGHPDPEHNHPACKRHHSQAHKIGRAP